MTGSIGALAGASIGAMKTVVKYKKSINTYSELKKQYKGSGKEIHHIIEKRLVKKSKWNQNKMPSVALDKATHRGYTNAWRKAIKYGTEYEKKISYKYKLYKKANEVYKHNRVLRMAARYTILKM